MSDAEADELLEDDCDEGLEEDLEDLEEDVEGFNGIVGIPKVAVELTRSAGSGCMPSSSPSSSSRLNGARVHAGPPDLVLVLLVVVVPTIPQPVSVALYSSVQVDEVAEAEVELPRKSVQVLKTSVTVVFWFSSQLLRFEGSPVLGPQPSDSVHFGPLQS